MRGARSAGRFARGARTPRGPELAGPPRPGPLSQPLRVRGGRPGSHRATRTRRAHIAEEAPPPAAARFQPNSGLAPLSLTAPSAEKGETFRFGPSQGEGEAGVGRGRRGRAEAMEAASRHRDPRASATESHRRRPATRYPALLQTGPWFANGASEGSPISPGSRRARLTLGCGEEPRAQRQQRQQRLAFPPRSHVCRYSTRARHRWLFSDAPVASEARQGYGQSRRITRGQGERGQDPGPQTGRASDASRRSGLPAGFALIASGPEPLQAGLRCSERRHRAAGPGPGPGARRAGQEGTKAARLREEARRGEERAQPGETRSGGSWRASQRVGAAGGTGRGGGRGREGRRASLGRGGGERRRQAASCTRSRCRGGRTQPSLPTERGRRLGRRHPRHSPASGPGLPAPRRAALSSASGAAVRRLGKESWALARGTRAPHTRERPRHRATPTPRGRLRGQGLASVCPSLFVPARREAPCVTWERNPVGKRATKALTPREENKHRFTLFRDHFWQDDDWHGATKLFRCPDLGLITHKPTFRINSK